MSTLIDTRDAFRRLQNQGGFPQEQADAIVDLFRDAGEEVATRLDIEEFDKRLTQRIELFEGRLGHRIQEVRSSVVSAVAAVGAVLAVVLSLMIYLVI